VLLRTGLCCALLLSLLGASSASAQINPDVPPIYLWLTFNQGNTFRYDVNLHLVSHEDTTFADGSVQSADHERLVDQVLTYRIDSKNSDGTAGVTITFEQPSFTVDGVQQPAEAPITVQATMHKNGTVSNVQQPAGAEPLDANRMGLNLFSFVCPEDEAIAPDASVDLECSFPLYLNVIDQNPDQSTSLTDQTETHLQRLDANGASFVQALNIDQTVDPSNAHMHGTGSGTYDLGPNGVWPGTGSANVSLQLDQTYTDDQQSPPRTADTTTMTLDLRYSRQ
jgi:hypothetical protein